MRANKLFISLIMVSLFGCSVNENTNVIISEESQSSESVINNNNDSYEYEVSGNKAKLLHYTGDYQEYIRVPNTIDGYEVTSIAKGCFKRKQKRRIKRINDEETIFDDTTFYIDENIVQIEDGAFEETSTFITASENNKEEWEDKAMSGSAKNGDGNVYYDTSAGDVFVHGGVIYVYEKIESGCFLARCLTQRKTFEVPSEVKGHKVVNIGRQAFYNNSHIQSVTFPETIGRIYSFAFSNCAKLKEVVFDCPNLTNIYTGAFYNCKNLKTVRLPENCNSIQAEAFYDCESISEIHVPVTMVSFHTNCFAGTKIEKVFYYGTEEQWNKIYSIDKAGLGESEIIFCGNNEYYELIEFKDVEKIFNGINVHGKGIISTYARGLYRAKNHEINYSYIIVTEESTGYSIVLYYSEYTPFTDLEYIGREIEFTGMRSKYIGCIELTNCKISFTEDESIHEIVPEEFDVYGDRDYQEQHLYKFVHIQAEVLENVGNRYSFADTSFYLYGNVYDLSSDSERNKKRDLVGKVVSVIGMVYPYNQEIELIFDFRNILVVGEDIEVVTSEEIVSEEIIVDE